jgi:hypothetical protein
MYRSAKRLSTKLLHSFFFFRCVLNWFGDWSNGALYQVGKEFTSKIDLDKTNVSDLLGVSLQIISANFRMLTVVAA